MFCISVDICDWADHLGCALFTCVIRKRGCEQIIWSTGMWRAKANKACCKRLKVINVLNLVLQLRECFASGLHSHPLVTRTYPAIERNLVQYPIYLVLDVYVPDAFTLVMNAILLDVTCTPVPQTVEISSLVCCTLYLFKLNKRCSS